MLYIVVDGILYFVDTVVISGSLVYKYACSDYFYSCSVINDIAISSSVVDISVYSVSIITSIVISSIEEDKVTFLISAGDTHVNSNSVIVKYESFGTEIYNHIICLINFSSLF